MQGIPFAIKDTFDLKGVATAYGSWQYLNNVIDDFESPLATNAIKAGAVPVFKSSVPQLTWGTANFNGTVYSCLHGGYSAGPGNSGGSSIGECTACEVGRYKPDYTAHSTWVTCRMCPAGKHQSHRGRGYCLAGAKATATAAAHGCQPAPAVRLGRVRRENM